MSSHYGKAAVRASLLHFVFGKALNAVVSLLTLVALARWMEPEAYGVYIAFLAVQSSFLALSSLGIDATVERFLPELRTRHADSELLGFVAASIGTRLVTLIFIALVAWFAAKPITSLIGLEQQSEVFRCWVWVFLLTGMLTFAVVLLDAMLYQRQSQRCISIYVVAKSLLIAATHQHFQLDLDALVSVELIASGLAAFVGCWLLIRHFAVGEVRRGWQMMVDNGSRITRFAFFNYVAQVVFQFFSVEMMKLLVTRLLGVLHSASYGFAYSLAETVQRYLPAVLLLRLIKPVFISRYTKTGDFAQLNNMARIILKLNLLILTPIIAFAAVFGADLLSLLSNGRYAGAHWILVGVLGLFVLSSHQLVLSLLASTLEKNSMQLYAGIVSTIAFPCALLFVPAIGPLGAVAASAVSGVVYNIFATVYLRRAGFDYRPDLRGGSILLLAGILLYGLALYLNTVLAGLAGLVAVLLVGSLSFLAIVRMLSVFSNEERELLNSILPKRVFVF
ncbi:Polysaccharide biosynthesis protein [Azoarcus sp. Aa7]|nr:Polysaccharide biosynthesis protein [Azoarcus sp. Aa7]